MKATSYGVSWLPTHLGFAIGPTARGRALSERYRGSQFKRPAGLLQARRPWQLGGEGADVLLGPNGHPLPRYSWEARFADFLFAR